MGLPLGDRKRTYNSRLAQELGLWAGSKNKGDAFHMAAFKAYFVDGKNIGKIPVLVDLAAAIDLPRQEATTVLKTRTFKAAVDADWSLAQEKGITAVPTFVMNHDTLVGAQPYDMLEKLMNKNGVQYRSETR